MLCSVEYSPAARLRAEPVDGCAPIRLASGDKVQSLRPRGSAYLKRRIYLQLLQATPSLESPRTRSNCFLGVRACAISGQ